MKQTIACVVRAGEGFYFIEEFTGSTEKDALKKARAEFPESLGFTICDLSTNHVTPSARSCLYTSLQAASAAL